MEKETNKSNNYRRYEFSLVCTPFEASEILALYRSFGYQGKMRPWFRERIWNQNTNQYDETKWVPVNQNRNPA